MAKSCVPDCGLVSRSVKQSAPCKDCPDRYVGCHGKCEKYKAYKERIFEDGRKRFAAYAPEQMHENYQRKLSDKIRKRMRTEGR